MVKPDCNFVCLEAGMQRRGCAAKVAVRDRMRQVRAMFIDPVVLEIII